MSRPVVSVLLVLSATAAAAPGRLLAQEARPAFGEGTHVFRRILHDQDFSPLTRFSQLDDDPKRTILVVLGDLNCLPQVPGGLRHFVARGGAALIASDRAVTDRAAHGQLAAAAGVEITGSAMRSVVRLPTMTYRDKDYCPLARPVPGADPALFEGVGLLPAGGLRVATNIPSRLRPLRYRVIDPLPVLARLPFGTLADPPEPANLSLEGATFAVGGEVGSGRLLVLADHSVFINEMMLPADNDNVEFAENCLRWLRGDHGQRSRVLFVEDGRVNSRFHVPLRTVGLPPGAEWALLALVNRKITQAGDWLMEVEDRDAFTRALFNRIPPRALYRTLLLLGSLGLLAYLGYRLGVTGRHHPELGLSPLAALAERHRPTAPVLSRRAHEVAATGNLREVARDLARQFLLDAGATEPGRSGGRPQVGCARGWWARRSWQRTIDRLWDLAGPRGARVSRTSLHRLRRDLDAARAALARGEIHVWADGAGRDQASGVAGR